MKIILPVAGKGTRLRPHTHTRAKSLVQVAGKPVLEHIVERLAYLGADEFIFITDENGHQIESYMHRRFPHLACSYVLQQERLGPAHAVYLAHERIHEGDDVLVVFNDTIFVADLRKIPQLCADCDGLIYSKEVEDYQRFGVNVVQGEYIVDMVEKPDEPISRLAQVGLYYLKDGPRLMKAIERVIAAGSTVKGEYYLPAVFMEMVGGGMKFKAPEIDAWLDCGKPETLLETNRYLLSEATSNRGEVVESVIIDPVYIGEGTVIRESVIGPNVSIGAGCTVHRSLLSDSIVHDHSAVSDANLQGSILGESVRLESAPPEISLGDHSFLKLGR